MKIERIKLICPKCGNTYDNFEMLSYNSHMADAARDFEKNNKPITHCPKCKVKLVNQEFIKYFDKKGNFVFDTKQLTMPCGKEFDFYCKLFNELNNVWGCINYDTLTLEGVVEKVKKENAPSNEKANLEATFDIINHVLIKTKNGKKEITLFDIVASHVDYSFGGRYNSFYIQYFTELNKSLLNLLETALTADFEILKVKVKTVQKISFDKKEQKYSK